MPKFTNPCSSAIRCASSAPPGMWTAHVCVKCPPAPLRSIRSSADTKLTKLTLITTQRHSQYCTVEHDAVAAPLNHDGGPDANVLERDSAGESVARVLVLLANSNDEVRCVVVADGGGRRHRTTATSELFMAGGVERILFWGTEIDKHFVGGVFLSVIAIFLMSIKKIELKIKWLCYLVISITLVQAQTLCPNDSSWSASPTRVMTCVRRLHKSNMMETHGDETVIHSCYRSRRLRRKW